MRAKVARVPRVGNSHRVAASIRARYNLRMMRMRRDLNVVDTRALADFEEAVRLAPSDMQARLNRGVLLLQARRLDAATEDLEAAVAIAPDRAEPYVGRSGCREARGDVRGAIDDLQSALDRAPKGWPRRDAVTRRMNDLVRRLK